MTLIPREYKKDLDTGKGNFGPTKLLPQGRHLVTILGATKNKDKYDSAKQREIVILRVKIEGKEDVYPVFLRLPISWSVQGATETQTAPKIHGRNLVSMLELIGKFHPGEELVVDHLITRKFIFNVKWSEPNDQGKIYPNIQKIEAPPSEPAQESPPPRLHNDEDSVPF